MLRLHLGIKRVRFVQTQQHLAVTLLRPEKLGQLLGDVRFEKEVASLGSVEIRLMQIVRRLDELGALPRDYAHVAEDFTAPRRDFIRVIRKQLPAMCFCIVVAAPRDKELNLVHRQVELAGLISLFLERAARIRIGGLCVGQIPELHVRETNVVQDLGLVISHPQRLISKVTQPERFESRPQISPDHCDGAEILIEHRDESSVARTLGLVACGFIDRGRLIEIAARLIDDSHDVECLSYGGRRADDIR